MNALDTGVASRIRDALTSSGATQTELAKRLGTSAGFLSEVARGLKRPGVDLLAAMRRELRVSIDWIVSGEGSSSGLSPIRHSAIQEIRMLIAAAQALVNDEDPLAGELLQLVMTGGVSEKLAIDRFQPLLDQLSQPDANLQLMIQLYNGNVWTDDPLARRRNVAAAAIAHFEHRLTADPAKRSQRLAKLLEGGRPRNAVAEESRQFARDN